MNSEKKKKISIKGIIGYVLSTLALIICIYIVSEVIMANTNRRPPRVFGLSISYVPTESMEPVIDRQSYVLFRQASYKDCNIDDIIVYYNAKEEKYIIHRVVAKVVDGNMITSNNYYDDKTINLVSTDLTNYLITKGDNNNNKTDTIPVTKDLVYGKYITGLGFMNILSGGINKNIIYFILIGIFVAMIAMQTIQVMLKKKADDAKKQNEVSKEQLLEELKKEILEEELAKIKTNNEIKKLEDELKEEVNTTIESEENNIEDDKKEE